MGRRGPAPTPTAILQARGSWRGKANKDEPGPEPRSPDCPEWLTDAAKEVWRQVVATVLMTRILTAADGNALGRYCDALVRWKKAAKWLDEKGETYPIRDDAGSIKCVMQYPQVAQYHKLSALLLKFEQEFGLTPSARSRLQIPAESNARAQAPQAGPPVLKIAN
jgi:P27 family predicted phage terminase small subunit